jgi:hypothetical protein
VVDDLSYVNSTSNTGAPPHRSSASGSITPNPMLLAGLDAVHRPCHQVGLSCMISKKNLGPASSLKTIA